MNATLLIPTVAIGVFAAVALFRPRVDFKSDTEGGIQFSQQTWEMVLAESKVSGRLIFLDVYATWCGPCKKLKSKTFADETVGTFFNANFINVAIDGETEQGKKIMAAYGVRSYPTLIFVDGDGRPVVGSVGYHSPAELLILGKRVMAGDIEPN